MPIITDQNIVPLAVAVLAGLPGVIIALKAKRTALDAKQTAVDNHKETRARLDDLETGRVPVKVNAPTGEGTP